MNEELRRSLFRQFDKQELIKIARDLGLKVNPQMPTITTFKAIIDDLETNGVPVEGASELTGEFLVAAEYIDEQGNLLEPVDEGQQSVEEVKQEDTKDVEAVDDKMPQCFKYALADERDPACKQCSVLKLCSANRIANRPDCFGLSFSAVAEECKVCIEAPFCRLEMEQLNVEAQQ